MQKLTQDYKYKKKDWKKYIIFTLTSENKIKNFWSFCFL